MPISLVFTLVLVFFSTARCFGQSYEARALPTDCGTRDQAKTTWRSGNTIVGYSCQKTLIFPQFSVGGGWTTEVSGFLPVQPNSSSLVTGTQPSFAGTVSPGDFATVSQLTTCAGLWESQAGTGGQTFSAEVQSGGLQRGLYTSIATCPPGSSVLSVQSQGNAQGPMQVQIYAPNAQALREATVQLTYFYSDPTFSWQAALSPIDVLDAKAKWTAPYYQEGGNVMAFSVVNVAAVAQSVAVTVRNGTGVAVTQPRSTPVLAAGCGCNLAGVGGPMNAAGGAYLALVADFFGGVNVATTGTIEFSSNSGQPFVVLVLRVNGKNLAGVPAI